MLDAQPLLVVVALLLVGGGFLIGLALGRSSNKLEARVLELEGELTESRAALARYREEVGQHFGKTSDLLRDLTLQYRAVYDHLAEGANSLCPDLSNGLPAGGVARLLAEHNERREEATPAAKVEEVREPKHDALAIDVDLAAAAPAETTTGTDPRATAH